MVFNTVLETGESSTLNYLAPLNAKRAVFAEFSGHREEEDVWDEFTPYLMDPANWDPTQPQIHRFVYTSTMGLDHRDRHSAGYHHLSLGVESRLEQVPVHYFSRHAGSGGLTGDQPMNLLDVSLSPYLAFDTQPISWLRVAGELRSYVLQYDVHSACSTTCSIEPNGRGTTILPEMQGNLTIGSGAGPEWFFNAGTGFFAREDREFAGSVASVQLNRATVLETGFVVRGGSRFTVGASVWQARAAADTAFDTDAGTFVFSESSERKGMQVEVQAAIFDRLTLQGTWAISGADDSASLAANAPTPNLIGTSSAVFRWNDEMSATLQWQHIGPRPQGGDSAGRLRSLNLIDLTAHLHWPLEADHGELILAFGIFNLLDDRGSFTRLFVDSHLGRDTPPLVDLHYFPGLPRTAVAGLTWMF